MAESDRSGARELRYPLGAAARVTGLSPDVLRAWERRYGAITPERTPGGTRRYSASDIERLLLLKAAGEAGHRIGALASLDDEELALRARSAQPVGSSAIHDALEALESLDGPEAEGIVSLQLAALGPLRFARDFALPIAHAIGDAWEEKRLCIASEHLGSALLRSMLGAALRQTPALARGPVILFATPSGERHEIGLLVAALTAMGAGANPLYLGPDLPADEVVGAASKVGASGVALAIVALDPEQAAHEVRAIRGGLDAAIEVWVGGGGAQAVDLPEGVELLRSLDIFEKRVALLGTGEGALA